MSTNQSLLNFSTWPLDAYIYLSWLLLIVLFVFILKRGRLFSALITVYPSLIIFNYWPFWPKTATGNHQLYLFLAIYVATFWIINPFLYIRNRGGKIQMNIFRILFSGLLISLAFPYLSKNFLAGLSGLTHWLFTNDVLKFLWLLLPLLFLFINNLVSSDD